MFQFGKKKRYSNGEKITYFRSVLSDSTSSQKRKRWAQLRLSQLNKKKKQVKVGDVFVMNDCFFGNHQRKPRLVVVSELKQGQIEVTPVRREKKIVYLSKFDGQRFLNFQRRKKTFFEELYDTRGFRIAKNAYLTPVERRILSTKREKI